MQAMPPFMSTAPRPYNMSPSISLAKGRMLPGRFVARRHHVGVAGQHEIGLGGADAGVKIFNVVRAWLREGHAVHGEARRLQGRLQKRQRAAFRRRHRRTAHEIAGKGYGIGGHAGIRDSGSGPYSFDPGVPRRQPSSMKYQIPTPNIAI